MILVRGPTATQLTKTAVGAKYAESSSPSDADDRLRILPDIKHKYVHAGDAEGHHRQREAPQQEAEKVKDTPERSARPATTRLAEAPIRVKLPPRHAPKESDHHRGSVVAAS